STVFAAWATTALSNPFGDGKASERILTILEKEWLEERLQRKAPVFQGQTYPIRLLISTSEAKYQDARLMISFNKEGWPFYPPLTEKGYKHLVTAIQDYEK
ncbi:MAG: hypothetical protein ACFFDT_39685, partial [Candidatus Hodarchaeota archaeon]